MLADALVSVATDGFKRRQRVHLATETLKEAPISEIEHVGHGLLRYRHHGQPNDHFVPERCVLKLSVMPPEAGQ
jgi:hypothetical protein